MVHLTTKLHPFETNYKTPLTSKQIGAITKLKVPFKHECRRQILKSPKKYRTYENKAFKMKKFARAKKYRYQLSLPLRTFNAMQRKVVSSGATPTGFIKLLIVSFLDGDEYLNNMFLSYLKEDPKAHRRISKLKKMYESIYLEKLKTGDVEDSRTEEEIDFIFDILNEEE